MATEPVDWCQGRPRSARFDDVYHSESGAVAQADHVFIGGCCLPAIWAGSPVWTVLETGFGLGLNFLALWRAWRSDPARPARLVFISTEAHPVAAADLRRAADAYPTIAPLGTALADAVAIAESASDPAPGAIQGFEHRFDDGRVHLNVLFGDAAMLISALRVSDAPPRVDSVFLDGFSPARNPDIWSATTLNAVARVCRPGTRLATWTVARRVRDGLADAGFAVARLPGLPPKRDCLTGILLDQRLNASHSPS